jgi:hypothetical protein
MKHLLNIIIPTNTSKEKFVKLLTYLEDNSWSDDDIQIATNYEFDILLAYVPETKCWSWFSRPWNKYLDTNVVLVDIDSILKIADKFTET